MILVLTWLILAGTVVVLVTRQSLLAHAETRRLVLREQARLLAESGLDRARHRLAHDAGYTGETWVIPGEELGGSFGAAVRIVVGGGIEESRRRVRVVARAGPDEFRGVQFALEATCQATVHTGSEP